MKRLIEGILAVALLAGMVGRAEDIASFETVRAEAIDLGGVKTNAWPGGEQPATNTVTRAFTGGGGMVRFANGIEGDLYDSTGVYQVFESYYDGIGSMLPYFSDFARSRMDVYDPSGMYQLFESTYSAGSLYPWLQYVDIKDAAGNVLVDANNGTLGVNSSDISHTGRLILEQGTSGPYYPPALAFRIQGMDYGHLGLGYGGSAVYLDMSSSPGTGYPRWEFENDGQMQYYETTSGAGSTRIDWQSAVLDGFPLPWTFDVAPAAEGDPLIRIKNGSGGVYYVGGIEFHDGMAGTVGKIYPEGMGGAGNLRMQPANGYGLEVGTDLTSDGLTGLELDAGGLVGGRYHGAIAWTDSGSTYAKIYPANQGSDVRIEDGSGNYYEFQSDGEIMLYSSLVEQGRLDLLNRSFENGLGGWSFDSDIRPSGGVPLYLGNSGSAWERLYVNHIYTDGGSNVVSVQESLLKDGAGLWESEGMATGGLHVVNYRAMTNFMGSVVSGGRFTVGWNGPTSTVYVVSLDGAYTNRIGDFYGM